MHLELFTRTFPPDDAAVLMVRGKMASVAGDMANARIAVRLGLDQLAYMMAMTKDRSRLFGASNLNIVNLEHFNETVRNLEDVNPLFAHKNDFVQEVVNRSIEMRSIEELYKISRLNIGVTATGQLLGPGPAHSTTPQFGINLSYSYIPQVLFATSTARTDSQFLNMVNAARIALDTYKYNTGLYVEAVRSLIINRKAVKASLDNILNDGANIDGVFLNSVIQLIDAHLKLNAAVHSALGALAYMRRLMVTEEKNVLNYVPIERNINAALQLFLDAYGKEASDEEYLDNVMRTLHRKSHLENLLSGKWKGKDGKLREFSTTKIQEAVIRNSSFLLYKRWNFPKSRGFFRVLKDFVLKHKLTLNAHERESLELLAKHIFVRNLRLKP